MDDTRNPAIPTSLAAAVVVLVGAATWALSHPYLGIFHDAGLYTLQALARLDPDTLGGDAFLKFGSQDRFTLWSPLYAEAARWLGIESAAALLTLLSQAALVACAWVLARSILPAFPALLGVAVLLAIPGDYGADRIFNCIEGFLTPRMAAEAAVLAALAAAMRGYRSLAVILTLAAALLHPLMAMAGACALFCLYVGERRPLIAAALGIVGVKALVLGAFAMPAGSWGRLDAEWLASLNARSPYLFLLNWPLDDWARAAVAVSTCVVAASVLEDARARSLARAAAIATAGGFLLTLIACDWLHLTLLTQLQPWRWQWLGTVVAALLLPQVLVTLGTGGRARRAAAVLLVAAWVFGGTGYALVGAAAALGCLAGLDRLKPRESRWVWGGALGLLAIAIVWRVASNLEFTDLHYADARLPRWLRGAMSLTRDGTLPCALLAFAWWLARRPAARPALAALVVFAGAACAALSAPAWRGWTAREFPAATVAQFAEFRRWIPPHAEVFWPESPLGVWVLLDRPSYLSVIQTSGIVFSRPAAREFAHRAQALRGAIAPGAFMRWDEAELAPRPSAAGLEDVCRTGVFDFLVTRETLTVGPVALAAYPAAAPHPLRLYRCGS